MYRKKLMIIITAVMIVCLSGCQSTPKESIVKDKNLDEMIEEAKKTDGTSDILQGSETEEKEKYVYQTTIEGASMFVKAEIDAKVFIPEISQMSIWEIEQAKITDEMLNNAITLMADGQQMYSGGLLGTKTKEILEEEIQFIKQCIDEEKDMVKSGAISQEHADSYIEECNQKIANIENEYRNAPDKIDFSEHPLESKLITVNEMSDNPNEKEYREYQESLNPTGTFYYGVTDGSNGEYISIYAQNNENYSNCIRGRKSKTGYPNVGRVIDGADKNIERMIDEVEGITKESAREQAEKYIKDMGFTDYYVYEIQGCNRETIYYHQPDKKESDGNNSNAESSHPMYVVTFLRYMDGVMVNNQSGEKFAADSDGTNKHLWPGESAKVYVDGSGVIGFDINSPLAITNTVVDKSKLKSWDEIREIFENMIPVIYAQKTEADFAEISVDEVTLSYSRISGKDNFEKGYIVPVWQFFGTIRCKSDGYGLYRYGQNRRSIITINAIDGTIIDMDLGY